MIKPSKIDVQSSDDKKISKIVVEPLERGFALTLGNALRRVLLSSIQGTAVTAIQIDGVLHEFSSINGVREDVTDIVLNIKSLSLKLKNPGPKKLIIDAQGPGEIKASMIKDNSDIILWDSSGYEKSLTWNYDWIKHIRTKAKKMVAGNITINKLKYLKNYADIVDVSGALETRKKKDIKKIKEFVKQFKKL